MSAMNFDGFISYNHRGDHSVAKALQRTLQRMGRKWYRSSALRIFRDDTTLAASPNLWSSIEGSLRCSRTFILLASPESATSAWVAREVDLWREERSSDDFFIVVTAGELVWDEGASDFDWSKTTALSEGVKGWFTAEPLWIDLRGHRQRIERGRFRSSAAAVAAAIHGVSKDDLLSEDVRRQRQLVSFLSALLIVALVAGAAAWWQRGVAVEQRDRADEQAKVALSRALAAESDAQSVVDPQLAAQLAIASYSAAKTSEAGGALLRQVDRNRQVVAYLRRGGDQPSSNRPAASFTPSRVAITDDGSMAAFGRVGDAAVTLWDVRANREVAQLRPESIAVTGHEPSRSWHGLSFSSDKTLVVADDGVDLVLWSAVDHRVVRTIEGGGGGSDLAISSDGRWLMRVSDARRSRSPVQLWRADTGEEVSVPLRGAQLISDNIEFDSAGGRAFASFDDGIHALTVDALSWSDEPVVRVGKAGQYAFAGEVQQIFVTGDGFIDRWDAKTGRQLDKIPLPGISLNSGLFVSADGSAVVAGVESKVVSVSATTGRVTELVSHRDEISDIAMSASSGVVVSVGVTGDVVLSTSSSDFRSQSAVSTGASDSQPILSAAFAGRAPIAALGTEQGIDVVDLPGLGLRKHIPIGVLLRSPEMALSPDGRQLAVIEDDQIHVIDAATGRTDARFERKWPRAVLDGGTGIAFVAGGTRLLVEMAGGPTVVDAKTGEVEQTLPVQERGGGGFAVTRDGGFAMVAVRVLSPVIADGGTVLEVWNWEGTRYARTATVTEPADARDIAISEDGRTAAIVDVDGRIIVIDLARPQGRQYLQVDGAGSFGSIAFTADADTLMHSDCAFNGVVIWDIVGGRTRARWSRGPVSDSLRCAGMSEVYIGSENEVLTGDEDGRATVWRADIPAAVDFLCSAVHGLSNEDRLRFLRDMSDSVPELCVVGAGRR